MAIMYVSSAGTNTAPYDTWAKAATTLLVATEAQVADNDIYILNTHTEAPTAHVIYDLQANVNIYSVTSGDVLSPGAEVASNGAFDLTIDTPNDSSTANYIYGLTLNAGDDVQVSAQNAKIIFKDCTLQTGAAHLDALKIIAYGLVVFFIDGEIIFGNAGSGIVASNASLFESIGTTYTATSPLTVKLHDTLGNGGGVCNIRNSDLSSLMEVDTPLSICTQNSDGDSILTLYRCILQPNQVLSSIPFEAPRSGVVLKECREGSEYYYEGFKEKLGELSTDAANYLNYTYDGTNGSSCLLSSTSDASITDPLRFKLIDIPGIDLVTAATFRVNTVTDNVILTDNEFWIDIVYPSNTSQSLGLTQSSRNSDMLSAGVNLTEDTTNTWTSPDIATDEERYIEETLPALSNVGNGVVEIWCNLARPLTNVWIDPAVDIT